MLSIKFAAESDLLDFSASVAEYERLWGENGERIVSLLEKHSGFSFKEKYINAVVINGISCSHPLSLRYALNTNQKLGTLVHELAHRLVYGTLPIIESTESKGVRAHKPIYLFLYDVWVELKGKEFADEMVKLDKSHGPDYVQSFDWAMSLAPEERKKRLELAKEGNRNAFL